MNVHSIRRYRSLAVLGVALAAACSRKSGDASAAADDVHTVVAAGTAAAIAQPFVETIRAIGTVRPRAGGVAVLSAPAPARVAAVLVTAGETVKKGQPLVDFDHTVLAAAAQSADAALTAAQLGRDRAERLVAQGVAARKDLEQAEAELAKAKSDAVAARRLADLAVLRSPIDGIVTRMTATLDATVDPSQPLVEVADPSTVDILLTVQPAEAARIRAGSRVTLRAAQQVGGEPLAIGQVVDIAGIVDSTSGGVAVRVRADSRARALRIGETLFGTIVAATRNRAVVVPLESLVPEGDGFRVFVVDSSSIAHARPVTVGGKTDSVAEILSGVAAGERVVTYGAFGVEDGTRIVAGGAASAAPASAAKGRP